MRGHGGGRPDHRPRPRGLRIVSDPTFDDPGPHGYLTKTAGPAVPEDQLGPVDLVLVSHDNHPDNELTTAVLDHHAAGFIYRSTDDTPAGEALARWATEIVPAVREAITR